MRIPRMLRRLSKTAQAISNFVGANMSDVIGFFRFQSGSTRSLIAPATGLPSYKGVKLSNLQWVNRADLISGINSSAPGNYHFEFIIDANTIISVAPMSAGLDSSGYYPNNGASFYRYGPANACMVKTKNGNEDPRDFFVLSSDVEISKYVTILITITATKTAKVKFIVKNSTIFETSEYEVSNPTSVDFAISTHMPYGGNSYCANISGLTEFNTLRGNTGIPQYLVDIYSSYKQISDVNTFIPQMTSASVNGFTVEASATYSNADYWKPYHPFGFSDSGELGSQQSGWCPPNMPSIGSPHWLAISFPSSMTVNAIDIAFPRSPFTNWTDYVNNCGIPKNFKIYTKNAPGSNTDSVNWTLAKTITNFDYTKYQCFHKILVPFLLDAPANCFGIKIEITEISRGPSPSGWDTGVITKIAIR